MRKWLARCPVELRVIRAVNFGQECGEMKMDKEQVLDNLCMYANHGTRYEDMEKAYNAGAKAERERCAQAIVDYSLSFSFDEDMRDLFAECAQFMRNGILPSV